MAASAQRMATQKEEASLVIPPIETVKSDGYVRPQQITEAQASVPMADFLKELSPTLIQTSIKRDEAAREMADMMKVEQYAPKTVKDFDKIFADPESYAKYTQEFNSLTLNAQLNLGQIIASKYADDTKLAIQSKAIRENWKDLSPEQFADKVKLANSAALDSIAKSNPSAFSTPKFISTFSKQLEEHGNALVQQHIPAYGEYMKQLTKSQVQSLAYYKVKSAVDPQNFQGMADEIATVIKEQYPSANSLDMMQDVIQGVISTGNIQFMENLRDGKLNLPAGKEGDQVWKTAYAQQHLTKAIIEERNRITDDQTKVHALFTAQVNLAQQYAQTALYNGESPSYGGLTRWAVLQTNDPNIPLVDPHVFSGIVIKAREEVKSILMPSPQRIAQMEGELSAIILKNGERSAWNYFSKKYGGSLSRASQQGIFDRARSMASISESASMRRLRSTLKTLDSDPNVRASMGERDFKAYSEEMGNSVQYFLGTCAGNMYKDSELYLSMPQQDKARIDSIMKRNNNVGGMGDPDGNILTDIAVSTWKNNKKRAEQEKGLLPPEQRTIKKTTVSPVNKWDYTKPFKKQVVIETRP